MKPEFEKLIVSVIVLAMSLVGAVAMASFGLTTASANAAIVVEEQFIYEPPEANIDTQNGGTGFDGAWVSTISHGRIYWVHSPGLSFSTLPVAGNAVSRFGDAGRAEAHRLISGASRASLTADGTTIWFSVLFQEPVNQYRHGSFLFGTDAFTTDGTPTLSTAGYGLGFTIQAAPDGSTQGNGTINALAFNRSTAPIVVQGTFTPDPIDSPVLIVGKINWKADGTPDELFLFNVTDLSTEPLDGEAIASITNLDFSQSAFDTVAMWDSSNSIIDEIRFGNTFANVMGFKSFISEELRVMGSAVREAKILLKEQRLEKAVGFLEKRIAEYEQWKERNPNHLTVSHELRSSDLYFLLAKAREASNKPRHAVAAAYKKTALVLMRQTKCVSALLWLFNNMPAADYVDVVKKSVRSGNDASDNIHHIAKDFESHGNWPAFKLFLNAIFSEVNDTTSCAEAIAEGLRRNAVWASNFSKYCRSKPELTEYVIDVDEELAQEHIRHEDFLKAAEIYRHIVNQCGPNQDRTIYELKVCECIYNNGQYTSAIPELNRFIRNNKATNRILVKQAILLKGQAYIQLGEMGRAYNTFLELMIDYPETKQAPEANFFIGYCNMLQGKYKEATEALNMVVKDCPQSSYASKARLCLTRIKRMSR